MPTTRARRKKPRFLEGLGLIGLDDIEPIVVAAAAADAARRSPHLLDIMDARWRRAV